MKDDETRVISFTLLNHGNDGQVGMLMHLSSFQRYGLLEVDGTGIAFLARLYWQPCLGIRSHGVGRTD